MKGKLFPDQKLPQLLRDKRKEIITLLKQNNIDISTLEEEIIKEQQSLFDTYLELIEQMNKREEELISEIMNLEQSVKEKDLKEETLLAEITNLKLKLSEQSKESSSTNMTQNAMGLRQNLNKNEGT